MIKAIIAFINRDICHFVTLSGQALIAITAYLIVVILAGYLLSPYISGENLLKVAAGFALLFYVVIGLLLTDRLYFDETKSGHLRLYRLSPISLWQVVLLRSLTLFGCFMAPMAIITPFCLLFWPSAQVAMDSSMITVILLLSGIGVSLVVSIISLFSAQLQRSGALGLVLGWPLLIPTALFAMSGLEQLFSGGPIWPSLVLLVALALFQGVIAAIIGHIALKQLIEQQ